MARFYGSVRGASRREVSRVGHRNTGIEGHVRGWKIGGRVRCYVGEEGEDLVEVSLTSGSCGGLPDVVLGRYRAVDIEKGDQSGQ